MHWHFNHHFSNLICFKNLKMCAPIPSYLKSILCKREMFLKSCLDGIIFAACSIELLAPPLIMEIFSSYIFLEVFRFWHWCISCSDLFGLCCSFWQGPIRIGKKVKLAYFTHTNFEWILKKKVIYNRITWFSKLMYWHKSFT